MFTFKKRIPITVIGGFLGSGKTTLVNHLIQNGQKRFGVIVNEFGSIGVDGALIQTVQETGVLELSNGCLCCVASTEFMEALIRLGLQEPPPEHILLELSGLADPVPVLQTLLDPQVRAVFELDSLLAVVDAFHFARTVEEHPECILQLIYANHILLNKTDLMTPEQLQHLHQTLKALSPLSSVVFTSHSQAQPSEVLGTHAFDPEWNVTEHHHQHTEGVTSFVLSADRPLDLLKWHVFLQEHILSRPGDVLRAKGFLAFSEMPEKVVFQAVRDVFSANLTQEHHQHKSQLVVIGRQLNAAFYQQQFEQCMTP